MIDEMRKNPHAVALGRRGGIARAESMTEDEWREMSSLAGKTRAKKLTKAQRSEIARKAAKARWKGHKKQS